MTFSIDLFQVTGRVVRRASGLEAADEDGDAAGRLDEDGRRREDGAGPELRVDGADRHLGHEEDGLERQPKDELPAALVPHVDQDAAGDGAVDDQRRHDDVLQTPVDDARVLGRVHVGQELLERDDERCVDHLRITIGPS